MKILLTFIAGITLLIIAVALGPLLILWSLNTLFPIVAIPYTWETWAAAFILSAPFSSSAFSKRKKD
jgi:hypothetical protein